MRLLFVNGEKVDIDESTAIGIDFSAYDITDPANRKTSVSNSFTIPKTDKNMRLFGYPGHPQSISKIIYNSCTCDYWVDSVKLIDNGSARVTEVKDRITILISEKAIFWDQLEDVLWPDFMIDFIQWLHEEKGVPSINAPLNTDFEGFLNAYINTNEGIFLPLFFSNLANYLHEGGTSYVETVNLLQLKYQTVDMTLPALGGHFCCYVKTIFEYIEQKYGIDFYTSDTETAGNIWLDEIVKSMYIPIRTLSVNLIKSGSTVSGFYFVNDITGQFLPETDLVDKGDKTLYSFVKSFFQMFNAIISKEGDNKYLIARFDDINEADVVDFSAREADVSTFKPILDNYNQNNYIRFSSIYDGGDPLFMSKKIVCKNKNIDAGKTSDSLIEIDAFIPHSVYLGVSSVPFMGDGESFSTFTFFVKGNVQASIGIKLSEDGVECTSTKTMHIAQLYSLSGEYNTIAAIAEYPAIYTIKKWLTLNDVVNLKYFKRYWVKQLNGYFFLNKISGFNPEKSNEATTIELIKLP